MASVPPNSSAKKKVPHAVQARLFNSLMGIGPDPADRKAATNVPNRAPARRPAKELAQTSNKTTAAKARANT